MKTTGQAIIVTSTGTEIVPHTADLIAYMEIRGRACVGVTKTGGRTRGELQGQPRFAGFVGPCWGGDDHPLRYEDATMNALLST